eukprot:6213566-Pleurochrysis_carterae.AAC.3
MRALVRFRLPPLSCHRVPRLHAGWAVCRRPSLFCVLRHAHALRPRCMRSCAFVFPLSLVPPRADVAAVRACAL